MIKYIACALVVFFDSTILFGERVDENALPKLTHIQSTSEVDFGKVKHDCSAIVFYGSWCTACTKKIRAILETDTKAKDTLCLISEDNNSEDALSYFDGKQDLDSLKSRTYLDSQGALGNALQIEGVPAVINAATGS